jgi:4-alpha-glucanotransferase
MRVLQFAFNGDPDNPHLPQHCVHNGVVYTGTHDNDTTGGWYEALPEHERRHLWNYLQRQPADAREATWELIRLAWSSVSALAIAPLQDLLGLGSAARMNVPGRAEGQWRWRCTDAALGDACWQRLHELTRASGRLASPAGVPA